MDLKEAVKIILAFHQENWKELPSDLCDRIYDAIPAPEDAVGEIEHADNNGEAWTQNLTRWVQK